MPELPEVETVMRALTPLMKGRRIAAVETRVPRLRTALSADMGARLERKKILGLRRRAKYILIDVDDDLTLLVHLGMSGRFFVRSDGAFEKHDHVVLTLDNGTQIVFRDPRRFGQVELWPRTGINDIPALKGLGPEPLQDDFTSAVLAARLQGKKTPIKTALLDQGVVAGLGNIYVSEALFGAGVHPKRLAGDLKLNEINRLVPEIKRVLIRSIDAGGSTLRDYRHPDGAMGHFQDKFAVYGRAGQACPGCTCDLVRTGGIGRIVQGGRSTFLCKTKQK